MSRRFTLEREILSTRHTIYVLRLTRGLLTAASGQERSTIVKSGWVNP